MASYRPKIKIDSAGNTEDLPLDAETLKGKNIDYFATSQGLANLKSEVDGKQDKLNENQLNAVNSGITQAKVTKYDGYEELINSKPNMSNVYTKIEVNDTFETKTDATSKLNKAKDHTTTEVSNLKKYTDEQFKKINDNLIATVDCSHKYEITGNTGDEHGLAIDDQQMLIKKIQGHSRRKSLNLLKVDDSSATYSGVTGSFKDGIATLNGTSTSRTSFSIINGKTLYGNKFALGLGKDDKVYIQIAYKNNGAGGVIYRDSRQNVLRINESNANFLEIVYISIIVEQGAICNNLKIYPMLVEGTYNNETMPMFQPYDNTLVNSNNTLISTGRNLIDIRIPTINASEWKYLETTTLIKGRYFIKVESDSNQGACIMNIGSFEVYPSGMKYNTAYWFDVPTQGAQGQIQFYSNTANTNVKVQIRYTPTGNINFDFEPYKQDIVQAPSLGEFDYYQEGKIYRQTSQVITLNGSENWGIDSNSPNKRFYYRPVDAVDNVDAINVVSNNLKEASANDTYSLSQENNLISVASNTIHIVKRDFTTVDQLKQWLQQNPIQLVYKLATPTIEEYTMPSGYAVYNGGLQIQQGDVPYTITKQYNLSQKAQILANIEIDREQQKQIDEVNNKIINLPSPSITNRTVKNISINNIFPQTLTPEQTKDVFNNDLFVILSVGGSRNFYEYKNVIENPSEGKTFINISPGMKDYASENVSFDILYVESNGYIRKESFQINKFPVYQHSILITDEKDTRILCSIVAKKSRAISTIPDLKYLINASGLRVVCNGFVKPTLTHQGGMAFELNTQSVDVKVKYVNLGNSIDYISDVALNSISNLKIIDTVYDYTVANG